MPRLPSARGTATYPCPCRAQDNSSGPPFGDGPLPTFQSVQVSAQQEELGAVVPDLALIQGGAGIAGSNVLAVTGVDTHVPGPPDQIAGLSRRFGDWLAGGSLGTRGARHVDPHLVVDVLGEARAVESCGGGSAPLVRRALVLASDIDDRIAGPAGTAMRSSISLASTRDRKSTRLNSSHV